jgi:hypothetical protein
MTFHQCCLAVLADPKADTYAKGYARAGLGMFEADYVQSQAVRILVNLSYWRGETAREVKSCLRKIGDMS